MSEFMAELRAQRWDDHRYYHHCRINQSLHFLSAISFLVAYGVVFFDPAMAALIAWLVAMVARQSGHFFFEPSGYDAVNQATHAHKEAIKVGYNLRRKAILHLLWVLVPLALWLVPDLFGLISPAADFSSYLRQVGLGWLALGVGGLVGRTVQLFFIRNVRTGLVWAVKILTDPFCDLMLYRKAPLQLLRGERFKTGSRTSP